MRIIYLLLTTILVVSATSAQCQLLEYQKIIEAPGVRPSIIIERANRWAASAFTNYQLVFQLKDTTTLILTPVLSTVYTGGKGLSSHSADHYYSYSLTIEAKQGRLRATVNHFQGPNGTTAVVVREEMLRSVKESKLNEKWKKLNEESWNKEYDQIDKEVTRILQEIEAAVKVAGKNEDW